MSYGYGEGSANPYDQRETAPGGYNAPAAPRYNNAQQYNAPAYGNRYNAQEPAATGGADYHGQNVEMTPLVQNGGQFAQPQDPNAILNECREIDRGIDSLEKTMEQLKLIQQSGLRAVDDNQIKNVNKQVDGMDTEIMRIYRFLMERVKSLKANPEHRSPRNAPQVGKVDRRLKASTNQYQNVKSDYRRNMTEVVARQYRIVRPDASEAEVRAAVEDTNGGEQIFQQALMQSNRRQEAESTLSKVKDRHEALKKIEKQMVDLAELFQQMEEQVIIQEPAVMQIEAKGEEVTENMDKANEQIGTAIVSARARNRKKWWCLGICVLIIIVIVIIVVIYEEINKPKSTSTNTSRRSIPQEFHILPVVPGESWSKDKHVVPGLEWSGEKLVIPGKAWAGDQKAVVPGKA